VTVGYAQRLGIGSVPSVPSLALGSGEVTLDAMTSAFSTFANGGLVPSPVLVRRVETSRGEVLYTDEHEQQRAVSETTAFQMSEMLTDVINSGTAWPARREGFMLPAAGKTGTTNDYHDAWFIGYTPHLAAGVWVGYDQPRTIIARGFAADLAVPMWARFMKEVTRNDKPDWLDRRATSRPRASAVSAASWQPIRVRTRSTRPKTVRGDRWSTSRTSSPAPNRRNGVRFTSA
jgi:penicillin-binding protein 1A